MSGSAMQLFRLARVSHPNQEDFMANSSFETFKQGGEAIDDAAKKTGQRPRASTSRRRIPLPTRMTARLATPAMRSLACRTAPPNSTIW